MRSFEHAAFAAAAALASLLAVRSAGATPNFPGAVARDLALEAAPDCSLCHQGTPGRGTVNTPFGSTMRSRGLVAYDEASLRVALDALSAEQKDSDGDGAADVAELKNGSDPNAPPGGSSDPVPEYGCTYASRRDLRSPAWPVVTVILLLVARRRRCAKHRVGAPSRVHDLPKVSSFKLFGGALARVRTGRIG